MRLLRPPLAALALLALLASALAFDECVSTLMLLKIFAAVTHALFHSPPGAATRHGTVIGQNANSAPLFSLYPPSSSLHSRGSFVVTRSVLSPSATVTYASRLLDVAGHTVRGAAGW